MNGNGIMENDLEINDIIWKQFSISDANNAIILVGNNSFHVFEDCKRQITKSYFTNNRKIVDLIYISAIKCFVLGFATSIVVIPFGADSIPVDELLWPIPIEQLLPCVADSFYIINQGGFINLNQVLSNKPSSPPVDAPLSLFPQNTGKSKQAHQKNTYSFCSNGFGSFACLYTDNKSKISLRIRNAGAELPSGSCWLTQNADLIEVEISGSTVDQTLLIAHQSSNSFSVFQTGKTGFLWSKFNSFGQLLFQKEINGLESGPGSGLQATEKGSWTVLYSRNGQEIIVLDNRIGIQIEKFSISRSLKNSVGEDIFLLSFSSPATLEFFSARDISTNDKADKKGKSVISFLSVPIPRLESSLSGSLLNMTHFLQSSTQSNPRKGEIISEIFSEKIQKDIHQNIVNFYQKIYLEEYQAINSREREMEDASNNRQFKKRKISTKTKQFYVTIEMEVVQDFLCLINAKSDDEVGNMDWEFLKLLIRSGMVSVKSHPRILSLAVSSQRLDILSEILRFVSDLNEDQCLFLLTYSYSFSDTSLKRFVVIGQSFIHKNPLVEKIFTSILETKYQKLTLVAENSQDNLKSEKKRKFGNESGNDKLSELEGKIAKIMGDLYHRSQSLHEFQLVQLFFELFFLRRVFFSSSLISDAIQKRTPSISIVCIFLRIMVMILQDHIPTSPMKGNSNSKHYFLSTFTSYQLSNLITFFEGIFDGYFLKFAIEINRANSELLTSFRQLINTINEMETIMRNLEELSSLNLIYRRTLSHTSFGLQSSETNNGIASRKMENAGNELNRKPLVDFYSLEKLVM